MVLSDLPEDFTPQQFMQLDRPSLDEVPYERKKWVCQYKGCTCGTHIRDYGISPYFLIDRNSKKSQTNPASYWKNLKFWYWLCGKHSKFFKRLNKRYDTRHIEQKILKQCRLDEKVISIPNKNMK